MAIAVAWGTISWVRSWTITIARSGVSRVGCWAISIARRAIRPVRSSFVAIARRWIRGYRWARGRATDIRLLGDRGRHADIRLLGRWDRDSDIRPSSSSHSGGSNRSSCCRAAVFAPMDSPVNPSNARCRKGPSDFGFSRVRRE